MNIGVIGCGTISGIYLKNAGELFDNLNIAALADLNIEAARKRGKEYGIPVENSPGDLLARDDIEAVLNLTVPAAHTGVNRLIIAAGKHAYSEKPAALNSDEARHTLKLARDKGVRVGSAPDTFLGAGLQLCRNLIDRGVIGEVVAVNASFTCRGHERWHPSPEFYYKKGGGPMLDMGPYYLTALVNLAGPIRTVSALTARSFPKRTISSEPLKGDLIDVEVNTHVTGSLEFENGAVGTITTSFDIWKSDQPRLEIHGSLGTISCPDPNTFGGPVKLFLNGDDEWKTLEVDHLPWSGNSRGLGLSDMVAAISENRPHRASGELAAHVLEVMLAFDRSAEERRKIEISETCSRPEAVPAPQAGWFADDKGDK